MQQNGSDEGFFLFSKPVRREYGMEYNLAT